MRTQHTCWRLAPEYGASLCVLEWVLFILRWVAVEVIRRVVAWYLSCCDATDEQDTACDCAEARQSCEEESSEEEAAQEEDRYVY